jgi:hypothetical protein
MAALPVVFVIDDDPSEHGQTGQVAWCWTSDYVE